MDASTSQVIDMAQEWFIKNARRGTAVINALDERNVDPVHARSTGIGYAPNTWTGLTEHLRSNGISDQALLAAGVAKQRRDGQGLIDHFRDRIMFPLVDGANVVGWSGRAIDNNNPAKYLNSPNTPTFDKSEAIFGLTALCSHTSGIVITEGPWDGLPITSATASTWVGVAACGTAFTQAHAQLIADTHLPVVVWMDPDAAGQTAAEHIHYTLASVGIQNVGCVRSRQDPSDTIRSMPEHHVAPYLQDGTPLAQVIVSQHLSQIESDDPAHRVRVARGLAPLVQSVPRDQQGQLLAQIIHGTGLLPETVIKAVASPRLSDQPRG